MNTIFEKDVMLELLMRGRPIISTPIERFLSKIKISKSGCWEWQCGEDKDGYGSFWVDIQNIRAHRFIYEYYHGDICPDLIIHHKCRNRKCANISHLEQTTVKENVLTGNTLGAINTRKTHCKRGHEFTKENTRLTVAGYRECKKCMIMLQRRYYLNKISLS